MVFGLGDLVGGKPQMKFGLTDEWRAAIVMVAVIVLLSAGFVFGTILGWFDRWQ